MSLFQHYILTFKHLCDAELSQYRECIATTDKGRGFNKGMRDCFRLLNDQLERLQERRSDLFLGSDLEKAGAALDKISLHIMGSIAQKQQGNSWAEFKNRVLIRVDPRDPPARFHLNSPEIGDIDAYNEGLSQSGVSFLEEVLPRLRHLYKQRTSQFSYEILAVPVKAEQLTLQTV